MNIYTLSKLVQTNAIRYYGISWKEENESKIVTRLNKLVKSHYDDFVGTPRLIISAILLMLFKYDCIHRKIEGKEDISNSKISNAFIITMLMTERQLLHSQYLNYITFIYPFIRSNIS